MIFPFTIKIIVRMLYFLKKNLFKILLRSYKILCKILQDYEIFLSHNLVRSYIRILTKILVKILNKIFLPGYKSVFSAKWGGGRRLIRTTCIGTSLAKCSSEYHVSFHVHNSGLHINPSFPDKPIQGVHV